MACFCLAFFQWWRVEWFTTHSVRYSARHHWHNAKQKRAVLIKRAKRRYVWTDLKAHSTHIQSLCPVISVEKLISEVTRPLKKSVADLHSKILDARPRGYKFFQFHAVFGKIWQNRMLAPPKGVGAPSSGKSWIRHWKWLKLLNETHGPVLLEPQLPPPPTHNYILPLNKKKIELFL